MMESTMNRHKVQVKRSTRVYQLGALGMLAAAGATVALPLGRVLGPEDAPVPTGPQGHVVDAPAKVEFAMATDEAAAVLTKMIGWKPAPAPPPVAVEEVKGGAEAVVAVAAPVGPTEWVYQGSMMVGSLRNALVKVNNEQHMLRVGKEIGNTTLVEIDPKFIVVEVGGVEKRIELAARVSEFPTDPPKGRAMVRTPMGNVPHGANQPGLNPAMPHAANKPGVPGNFDQMRAQAEELARKRGVPAGRMPGEFDPSRMHEIENIREKLNSDPNAMREAYERMSKVIVDPSMSTEQRASMLNELGITPGTPPETVIERFRATGLNPEEHPSLLEAARYNAKVAK